eukprot:CAMPEP_0179177066 /NCGR_PEP_ID=MMETSP0796-20121207/87562_1 /TAXON_ID=73915 /ORGANISM="Pyrodinium bahamense, Strain pbaha01" /LENGTH=63 /DNA_ID=CAMNT_0020880613 /DNA_START=78 /DNA_END=266 /DNA_ORIENTATION=+
MTHCSVAETGRKYISWRLGGTLESASEWPTVSTGACKAATTPSAGRASGLSSGSCTCAGRSAA